MSSPPSSSSAHQIRTPEHTTQYPIPPNVLEIIQNVHNEDKKVIVMTCGIAGSGKSTLARNLETKENWERLSIDALIFSRHGVYGRDYPFEKVSDLQDEAEILLKSRLATLLREGARDIVLDLSLYSKSDREFYRDVVKREGGGRYDVVLVVFKVRGSLKEQEKVLWQRIEKRGREWVRERDGVGVDGTGKGRGREGMLVERSVLGSYLMGFEWPDGEGEVVVDVD